MVINTFDRAWKKIKLSAYYHSCARKTVKGKWRDSGTFPPKEQVHGRHKATWYWCMDETIYEYHAAYRLYEKGKWKC